MKAGFLGALAGAAIALVAVVGGGAALSSCTIDRPSDSLKCTTNADCAADRLCQSGYCVVGNRPVDARDLDAFMLDAAVCPSVCTGGCDFTMTKCTIAGTGGGNVTCPTGWNCDIFCATAGACGAVNCDAALSCKVACSADGACASVSCATKDCNVTCTAANACGNVTCTSGNCTETCEGGSGSAVCGDLTCGTGACQRTCTGTAACGNMTCGGGSCTELCKGGSDACGTASCGTGKCTATCQGNDGASSACGDVACGNACQCDVNCDVASNLCPATMTCPDPPPGGGICDDTLGRCDSSQNTTKCRKCM